MMRCGCRIFLSSGGVHDRCSKLSRRRGEGSGANGWSTVAGSSLTVLFQRVFSHQQSIIASGHRVMLRPIKGISLSFCHLWVCMCACPLRPHQEFVVINTHVFSFYFPCFHLFWIFCDCIYPLLLSTAIRCIGSGLGSSIDCALAQR